MALLPRLASLAPEGGTQPPVAREAARNLERETPI